MSSIKGMHYNPNLKMYVPDVVEEEVDPFTLVEAAHRFPETELPQSPKALYKLAASLDWEVRSWRAIGTIAPTLYMSSSDEGDANPYSAGDVRFDGYDLTIYTVEAREPRLPLGFQARFEGKFYGPVEADKRNKTRNTLGSFESARIADPVGVPVELRFDYQPMTVKRGDFETEQSYNRRLLGAQRDAATLNREMNDGSYWMWTQYMIFAAKPLTAWLNQWGAYGALSHETDREAA